MSPLEYLVLAISGGDEVELEDFYWGPDYSRINAPVDDYTGETWLHFAIRVNNAYVVKQLLLYYANPNVLISGGQTSPLHIAAGAGYFEIVKILVERQEATPPDSFIPANLPKDPADPNLKTKYGVTASSLASTPEIYKYLVYRENKPPSLKDSCIFYVVQNIKTLDLNNLNQDVRNEINLWLKRFNM